MRQIFRVLARERRGHSSRFASAATLPCLLSIALGAAAWAHYLPPVVEEYRLLSPQWQLCKPNSAAPAGEYELVAQWRGRCYRFPVKDGFIAQSVRGNDLNEKDVPAVALAHIEETEGKSGILIFKVASLTEKGQLFVRSFKIFDAGVSFARACKLGSPILGIDGPEVVKLGCARYTDRVVELTGRDWQQVEKRGAGSPGRAKQ